MTDTFVHPQALCESPTIGGGTRIAAFARVLPGAVLGRDCRVEDSAFIDDGVEVGDRAHIAAGAKLRRGVTLEADVVIGTNASLVGEDESGRAEAPEGAEIHVGAGARIGANATLLSRVRVGERAVVRAGALVTRSVPPHAVVAGNPAQIVGYVESLKSDELRQRTTQTPAERGIWETSVRGVTLHRFPVFHDLRGDLTVGDFEKEIPFVPRRFFMVFDVPGREVRGEHAHRRCHLFLVCPTGSCSVVADDGERREEFTLDAPNVGVHLPPMVWGIQYRYSREAVLLAFASDHYDPDDYIRDYQQFLEEVGAARRR